LPRGHRGIEDQYLGAIMVLSHQSASSVLGLQIFPEREERLIVSRLTAVVNALAKAGIELGENGSIVPRPKKAK
jgi:hypothetical protein